MFLFFFFFFEGLTLWRWWRIVFVECLTDERQLAFVRDSHHCKSPTRSKQDLSLGFVEWICVALLTTSPRVKFLLKTYYEVDVFRFLWGIAYFNPLSTNPTKWSNILKQFVGKLPMNCLSVFDHFETGAKRVNSTSKHLTRKCFRQSYSQWMKMYWN